MNNSERGPKLVGYSGCIDSSGLRMMRQVNGDQDFLDRYHLVSQRFSL